jgi:hypothetical protein
MADDNIVYIARQFRRRKPRRARRHTPDHALDELMALRNRMLAMDEFLPPSIQRYHSDWILEFVRICRTDAGLMEPDMSPLRRSVPDNAQLAQTRTLAFDMKTIARRVRKTYAKGPQRHLAAVLCERLVGCANGTLLYLSFFDSAWPEEWRIKRAMGDTGLDRKR